jgi:hypothetical protein
MRVMLQILSPRMQDREEADLGAQVLRIGGDRAQRFGAGAKQQIVERPLVLERESGDGFGKREDDMEILGRGEELRMPAFEPLRAGE